MEYISFNKANWDGRIDLEDGELGLRLHQLINPYNNESESKVLLGFCSDEGVKRNKGRLGAKSAPNFIRKALSNLPVHFKNNNIFDAGDILVNEDLEESRKFQTEKVYDILNSKSFPLIIGGGHETALGNYLAFIKHYPEDSLVINLDAHFDIRLPNPISTSGTPFYEMNQYAKSNNLKFNYLVLGIQQLGNTQALFKRADELKINYKLADDIHADFNSFLVELNLQLKQYKNIYLSVDMDVFDVAYAPGVSAPTINGLTPYQIKTIINSIKATGNLKIADFVEVNPEFDRDYQTSKLASHLMYNLLTD